MAPASVHGPEKVKCPSVSTNRLPGSRAKINALDVVQKRPLLSEELLNGPSASDTTIFPPSNGINLVLRFLPPKVAEFHSKPSILRSAAKI
jgi:hypothetical protein